MKSNHITLFLLCIALQAGCAKKKGSLITGPDHPEILAMILEAEYEITSISYDAEVNRSNVEVSGQEEMPDWAAHIEGMKFQCNGFTYLIVGVGRNDEMQFNGDVNPDWSVGDFGRIIDN